jgi:hypothetical protein
MSWTNAKKSLKGRNRGGKGRKRSEKGGTGAEKGGKGRNRGGKGRNRDRKGRNRGGKGRKRAEQGRKRNVFPWHCRFPLHGPQWMTSKRLELYIAMEDKSNVDHINQLELFIAMEDTLLASTNPTCSLSKLSEYLKPLNQSEVFLTKTFRIHETTQSIDSFIIFG